MKLNCAIVDDEPVARAGIAEYVQAMDCLTLIGECENATATATLLSSNKIDLLFLDIHMPGQNGIEFLKSLPHPPMAIFTTAFSNYAAESYDLQVIDYLVKPIRFERFKKAVLKACDFYTASNNNSAPSTNQFFFVKSEGKYEKIFFDEVLFIESLQNYIVIHTSTRKMIAYLTLSGIESQLPPAQFIKVHKSFIVSIPRVTAIEGNELLIGDKRVPISRMHRDAAMEQIMGNNLFKR